MNKSDLMAVPIGTLKVTRGATKTCPFAQWRRGCAAVSGYFDGHSLARAASEYRHSSLLGEADRRSRKVYRVSPANLAGDNRSRHTSNARSCTRPDQGPDEIIWPRQG